MLAGVRGFRGLKIESAFHPEYAAGSRWLRAVWDDLKEEVCYG
jgi:hypothetical protein